MESKDILQFLESYTPEFRRVNGEYEMFTIPTQHIRADSIEELISIGIKTAKELNGKSPFGHMVEWYEREMGL